MSLYARMYGRGPDGAQTHLGTDWVLTILGDSLTPAERTLVAANQARHVQDTRRAFQEAVEPEFIEIVEGATGQKVRSFMSQVDVNNGLAIEFFMLEEGAPETDAG